MDAKLDRIADQRRTDWPLWMGKQVRKADHILVIASAAYRKRAEGDAGRDEGRGVQWEARLIRDAFYDDQRKLDRFIPVVLSGQSRDGVPDFLGPNTATVYTVAEFTKRARLSPNGWPPPTPATPNTNATSASVANDCRHCAWISTTNSCGRRLTGMLAFPQVRCREWRVVL